MARRPDEGAQFGELGGSPDEVVERMASDLRRTDFL
jgi:hypothetical protein